MVTRLLALMVVVCQSLAGAAYAATSHYQRDDEGQIVDIDGKPFIIHTVSKGESLYGISKRYGVSLAEIALHNPDVYYGVQVGQKLRIPTSKVVKAKEGAEFSLHLVEEGETLYSIARRYGMSVAQLQSYNGLHTTELPQGAILRIPSAEVLAKQPRGGDERGEWHTVRSGETLYSLANQYGSSVELIRARNSLASDVLSEEQRLFIPQQGGAAKSDTCATMHVVKRGESLYRIAKQYEVPLASLLKANPIIVQQGLRVDDALCIPSGAQPTGREENAEQGGGTVSIVEAVPVQVAPTYYCDSSAGYPAGRTLRCALMLPFSLEATSGDSLKVPSAAKSALSGTQAVSYDSRFLGFYKGVLLALEQFKASGYRVALNVLDTRNSPAHVQKLLGSDTLAGADIIIGPVYPQNITEVSQYAASRRITMVSPLSGSTPSFEMNPFLFQANPSTRTQLRAMANGIEFSDTTNVVLVREEDARGEGAGYTLHLMLESRIAAMQNAENVRYSVVDCALGDASAKTSRQIEQHLLRDRRNVVIVASNREPLVSALLGQLAGVMRVGNYRMEVYGMPQWLKMTKLDFGHLLALNAHVFSPYFVDYESARVCSFVRHYREAYLEEPTQFAFQGYDVTTYFLRAMFKYGMDFRYCIDKVENWQLQNTFQFRQSKDFGTYESEGVFLLRFDKGRGLVRAR